MANKPLTFWQTAWAVGVGVAVAAPLIALAVLLGLLSTAAILGGVGNVLLTEPTPTEWPRNAEERAMEERLEKLREEYGRRLGE